MKKVRTLQIGHRLLIVNGIDPLMYVDLKKRKLVVYPGHKKLVDNIFNFKYKVANQ